MSDAARIEAALRLVAAAVILLAIVMAVLGVLGLLVTKSFDAFGKQLAQFGRSIRSVLPTEVAPRPPLEQPTEPDPGLTTADAVKSEALRGFELERVALERAKKEDGS
jgi:hypothetical protein